MDILSFISGVPKDVWLFIFFILIGYGLLSLSRTFKLPEPILLFVLGLILQFFIGKVMLVPFVVLALILLLFDAGAHFIPRKFTPHSLLLSEFIIYSIVVNSLAFGLLLHITFIPEVNIFTIILSIIIGSLATACSQFEIMKGFKIKKNRLYYLTEQEDHLSNPIVLAIAVILVGFIIEFPQLHWFEAMKKLLATAFVDIGVGIFLGLIMLYFVVRLLKRNYMRLTAMLFALFTYIVAVELKGMGFLSVLVMSLFYHNVSTKEADMGEFAPFISNLVYVFIFITMGYIISLNGFILIYSLIMLLIYLVCRLILFHLILRKSQHFMTLDCPKGLAVGAVVLFIMVSLNPINPNSMVLFPLFSAIIIFFMLCNVVSYIVNVMTKDIIK